MLDSVDLRQCFCHGRIFILNLRTKDDGGQLRICFIWIIGIYYIVLDWYQNVCLYNHYINFKRRRPSLIKCHRVKKLMKILDNFMISPSLFFTWKKLYILHYCNEIYFLKFLIRKCKAPEFYKHCLKSKVNVTYLEITADFNYIFI